MRGCWRGVEEKSMCRFFIYKGEPIFLGDILTRPEHSLLTQARRRETYTPGVEMSCNYCPAKQLKRDHAVNADGFGVGFFNTRIRPEGTLFKSVLPAWSNNNLTELSEITQCNLAFAHIRAASLGMPISEFNCHPFRIGKFMWMHNGGIAGFQRIKRALSNSLPPSVFNNIHGTTDSEMAFAIFMSQFPDQGLHGPGLQYTRNPNQYYSSKQIQVAMRNTIVTIMEAQKESGMCMKAASSSLNFAVTDGRTIIAVRCRTHATQDPPSLYYGHGSEEFTLRGKKTRLNAEATSTETRFRRPETRTITLSSEGGKTFIIASEPLDYVDAKWHLVPKDHMVVIDEDEMLTLVKLELPRFQDIGVVSMTPALSAADFQLASHNMPPDDFVLDGNPPGQMNSFQPIKQFRTLALTPTSSPGRKKDRNSPPNSQAREDTSDAGKCGRSLPFALLLACAFAVGIFTGRSSKSNHIS